MRNVLEAPEEILAILRGSVIDGDGLTLQGQLDRKQYEAVNKFLVVAGAKWDKRAKRHIFTSDLALEKLRALLDSGNIRDDKKHFQQFFTPRWLAIHMVDIADLNPKDAVLEPSAGHGAIVEAILDRQPDIDLMAIDLDPTCMTPLRKTINGRGFSLVVQGDFFTVARRGFDAFSKIIMNPPFANGQDVAHIEHALTLLKPGGRLVAICANGPRQNGELRRLVDACGGVWEELPNNTFADAGVRAVLLSITAETPNA